MKEEPRFMTKQLLQQTTVHDPARFAAFSQRYPVFPALVLHAPTRQHAYSHSIDAGGLAVTSYSTRFTPGTSAIIRADRRSSSS